MSTQTQRSGGQILVQQLRNQGVRQVYCVPGESYLAVLDALYDTDINITVCRQEGGAAMMAEAAAKLSGEVGICMVTRAPGATNAYAGVHIAKQDSTPMILFVGQVARDTKGREAFQEMDYASVFGSQTKWAVEIDCIERIPEIVHRAFHTALSGRPGPVVVALPEDMLTEMAAVADAPPCHATEMAPTAAQWQQLESVLNQAQRPLFILGGSTWQADAAAAFADWAAAHQVPVAVEFRRQMLLSAHHPCYVGDIGLGLNPKLLAYVQQADCIVLLGGRLPEVPSQNYTLLNGGAAKKVVHIHPDVLELHRVYAADVAINTTAAYLANGLAAHTEVKTHHADWLAQGRQNYLAWSDTGAVQVSGKMNPANIIRTLQTQLAADAIITNGAGNYAAWLHRFYRYGGFGTQLAPTSGSMGYGLPAAVAAKNQHPEREVICFAGDGCFMMHGQEFATAAQYQLPIMVIIFDNSMYGTIRMHQERHYPLRECATALHNPDFAAYAQAFGGFGARIESDQDFLPAYLAAKASGKPAILHCILEQETLSPTTTLSQLRAAAG